MSTTRIRFDDAAAVFDAFPVLSRMAERPGVAIAPLDYAKSLADGPRPASALAFIAHLLPRREAIWWGCQCLAALMGAKAKDEATNLALEWVRDPDESLRRQALAISQPEALSSPTAWLARAVAYSGGSLLAPEHPVMSPPPEACAQSVNAAIVLAATTQPPPMILPWLRACATAGIRFAEGQDARVVAPPPPSAQAQLSPQ